MNEEEIIRIILYKALTNVNILYDFSLNDIDFKRAYNVTKKQIVETANDFIHDYI